VDLALANIVKNTQQFLAEFWTPADRLPYLLVLDMLDFSILRRRKVQLMPHANFAALHSSIAMEWDWLTVEYICKACCSFCRCRDAVVAKNGAYIE
jgi:hypothetical protein